MGNQETEGLFSPVVRRIRQSVAAKYVPAGSVVLDLACGAGFFRSYLPGNCKYYGVDRIEPPGKRPFDGFYKLDLSRNDVFDLISSWLSWRTVDVVTMLAFIEHINCPVGLLRSAGKVLKEDGVIVLTTPHPAGAGIYSFLARMCICSRAGAEEHNTLLDESDLRQIFADAGFKILTYRRFLFGLNQLIVARPSP